VVAAVIDGIVATGLQARLSNNRTAYWHGGMVVIDGPGRFGTAFRPRSGQTYFNNLT